MKLLTVIVLTLTVAVVAAGQKSLTDLETAIKPLKNSGRYSVKYDKFDDKTTVAFSGFLITAKGANLMMMARFQFDGQNLTEAPTSIIFTFMAYSRSGWYFLRSRNLDTVIDGEPVHFGEGGRASSSGGTEYLVFQLPADDVGKLANGKVVDVRVGPLEFTLKPEHQQMLKDLLMLAR